MIKLPPKPSIDVLHPDPWVPSLGTGVAAGALPRAVPSDRGRPLFEEDFKYADAAVKIDEALSGVLPEKRRDILQEMKRKLTAEKIPLERKINRIDNDLQDLRAFQEATLELMRWQKDGLQMQRPTSSNMHHLLDAMAEKRVRLLYREAASLAPAEFKTGHLVGEGTHAFLIEHDWAGVFEKASDFAGHDFRLPYPSMCFEFRISGKNVCVMITSNSERKLLVPFVDSKHGWALPKFCYFQDGDAPWRPTQKNFKPGDADEYEPLRALICGQIRAACISLEAKATTTEVIRASHKLNHSREKRGRAPIADYHVIKLADRHRALPREGAGDAEPWAKKRLHFRRGHDRHYQTHKVWINWTLVGDPDLGFVDKHYRL